MRPSVISVVGQMVKVILDSNFLFIPFQFRIDIFEQLEILLGKSEPIILSTTLKELENLAKRRSIKMQRQAAAALDMAKKCRIVEAELAPDESYDDVIIRTAKEWRCPVATNDTKLRKRLREAEVTVIYLRQKSRLEIQGHIS